jgi:glycosyltransferase involved in cell wall biosynthesis
MDSHFIGFSRWAFRLGYANLLKEMNVLIVTDMFPTRENPVFGVFIFELSRALTFKNRLVVIHPQLWNPMNRNFRTEKSSLRCRENGIEVFKPKLFVLPKGDRLFFRSIVSFFTVLPSVIKLKRRFCFDIIHAHMACPAGFTAILLGIIFRKPVLVTVHGSDIHTLPKYFFLKYLILFTLKRAHTVIAVSQSLKDSILKMGSFHNKVFVIHNGARHDIFSPMDKIKARRSLNFSVDRKIILFIGSLIQIKGIDILLRAFVNMSEENHSNLVIIGKGELYCQLKVLAKKLGIETRVHFMGSRKHDEIPLWLNACDVFCLPSRNEGFPTVIVEALACGRPVVATKVGGIPEAVTNDTLGILVEPNNTEELAAGLNKALEKEWDYQAIAEYGKRFSWNTIAEEYTELYKNVVLKK